MGRIFRLLKVAVSVAHVVLAEALRIERLLSNLTYKLGKPAREVNPASTLRMLAIAKMNLKLFDEAHVAGEEVLDIQLSLGWGVS